MQASNIPSTESHVSSFSLIVPKYQSRSEAFLANGNRIHFYGEDLLAPRPTPKLKDHSLTAVHDCLFNIFAATLHIGGRSSNPNLRTRHAVVTGTRLSHLEILGLKREM